MLFCRTEGWNPLHEFLQFSVLVIARNRQGLPKAAKIPFLFRTAAKTEIEKIKPDLLFQNGVL